MGYNGFGRFPQLFRAYGELDVNEDLAQNAKLDKLLAVGLPRMSMETEVPPEKLSKEDEGIIERASAVSAYSFRKYHRFTVP